MSKIYVSLLVPFYQLKQNNFFWLQKRQTSDFLNGKLEFIGGKIEGETPREACIRETKEEVGVELNSNYLNFFKTYEHKYRHLEVSLNCFTYKAGEYEFEKSGWFSIDKQFLKKYEHSIPEANVEIIKDLLQCDFSHL